MLRCIHYPSSFLPLLVNGSRRILMMMCNGRIPNDEVSIGSNISATSSAQDIDVLEPILSSSHHKSHTITLSNDVSFTKGATDDKCFDEVSKIDMRKFDN